MITLDRFSKSLERLLPRDCNKPIAIAVSGGADSLCLTLLLNKWALANNNRIIALTVDHKLRAESTAEAHQVSKWLTDLGIEHHILTWRHKEKPANIQTAARQARYALLEKWCQDNEVPHLALAHHQDDQVETLLQRLAHHSGPQGLAGMADSRNQGTITLVRPLLGFSKADIIETMRAYHLKWIEDPSNQNQDFTRIKIRQMLPEFLQHFVTRDRILRLQNNMAIKRQDLEREVLNFIAQHVVLHPEGFAAIQKNALEALPTLIKEVVLKELLKVISGKQYYPNDAGLQNIQTRSLSHNVVCCHGCVVMSQKGQLLIVREFNNIGPSVILHNGTEQLWDNRFLVKSSSLHGVMVDALGSRWKLLKDSTDIMSLPLPVRLALPSFWIKERLLSVPNLGYYEGPEEISECKALFYPTINLCRSRFIFG